MTVKFKFVELIVSRMQPIINMHRVLALGGRQPAPYGKRTWQAEHPAVHRMRHLGSCPDPQIYENWQAVLTCQLFHAFSPLRTSRFSPWILLFGAFGAEDKQVVDHFAVLFVGKGKDARHILTGIVLPGGREPGSARP